MTTFPLISMKLAASFLFPSRDRRIGILAAASHLYFSPFLLGFYVLHLIRLKIVYFPRLWTARGVQDSIVLIVWQFVAGNLSLILLLCCLYITFLLSYFFYSISGNLEFLFSINLSSCPLADLSNAADSLFCFLVFTFSSVVCLFESVVVLFCFCFWFSYFVWVSCDSFLLFFRDILLEW